MAKALIEPSGTTKHERSLDQAWERRFSQLAAFKKRHGHCCPSRRVASLNELVCWIDEQREKYEEGILDYKREQRLDDLGFCWDLADEKWETHFAELVAFKKKHGHPNPPKRDGPLDRWASKQRWSKNKGWLDPERRRRLDNLGFSWDPLSDLWETRFAELVEYKKKHGHPNPPKRAGPLDRWAGIQRRAKTKGLLDPERERRLDELGFSWNVMADAWEKGFAELVAFKKKHGHPNPSIGAQFLGRWASRQRQTRTMGKLSPEREARLDALGFSWTPNADAWEIQFANLVAFKKKHGHANPVVERVGSLGHWLAMQRRKKVLGIILPEREQRLSALGLSWTPKADAWEIHFAKLVAFKKKHGHCNPAVKKTGILGNWVGLQRNLKKNNLLDPEREQRLDEIGFVWNTKISAWETRFSELVAFKKKNGDANPAVYIKPLGKWVHAQRRAKIMGELSPERERRLNKLGFSWGLLADAWEAHFADLVAFKKKHGHAIPGIGAGDLAKWAVRQRLMKAKGRLEPEREQRLNEIGFVWNTRINLWESRFAELVAFKKRHDHASPTINTGILGKWVDRQRVMKAKGCIEPERERRLDELGFIWRMDSRRRPA